MFFLFLLISSLLSGASPDPDSFKSPSELIRQQGYPCEEYSLVTKDGYILTLQRIPHGLLSPPAPHKPVVLLVHGLFSSSTQWVLNYPHQSLGFILADKGYDVWLGNFRGSPYANEHVWKRKNTRSYWNYGVDEVALYDIPALIDFTLKVTHEQSLFYIGFSQGNMAAFAMLADLPEYNHKIKLMVGMAPVCNMTYIQSPAIYLAPFSNLISLGANLFFQGSFLQSSPLRVQLINTFCRPPVTYLCGLPTFFMFGVNINQLNQTRIPVYVSNVPVGASKKNVAQFAQFIKASNFRHFDYGEAGNMERYGVPFAPKYETLKITAPIALITSKGDYFGNPDDVRILRQSLKSIVFDYVVPDENFVHLDFVFGLGARKLVYEPMIKFMNSLI